MLLKEAGELCKNKVNIEILLVLSVFVQGGKPSAKDHGRRRRTLLAIERLYSLVLNLEDLDLQVLGLPESDHGPLLEKRKGLVSQMCSTLRGEKGDGLRDRYKMLPLFSGARGRIGYFHFSKAGFATFLMKGNSRQKCLKKKKEKKKDKRSMH